jgi:transposase-like protein
LFTNNVLATALNEEMTQHLGYEKNRANAGRESANVPNIIRSKTVASDAAGEVRIDVPRDREGNVGSPQWTVVLALYAKELATGGDFGAFRRDLRASVLKETISRITEKVLVSFSSGQDNPPER